MKPWRITWAIWSSLVLASFAVLEWLSIRAEKPGAVRNTLSSSLRSWLGIAPAHWRKWIFGTVFTVFFGWFVGHIVLGWAP